MSRYGRMRNKPCPCGSGRKWKRCCRGVEPLFPETEFDLRLLGPSETPAGVEPIDFSQPNGMRVVTIESSEGPGQLMLPASAVEIPESTMEWLRGICQDPEIQVDGVTVRLDEHETGPLALPGAMQG